MMTLDDKIVRKREELRKLREEGALDERENHQKKAADLETKKESLKAKMREILKEGVDLAVFSQVMQEVNDKAWESAAQPDYYTSLTFSHEVLLLNTVHMMGVHEQLLWHCVNEGRNLAKFVERRKIALRQQNSEFEIKTVRNLTKQYATMKMLEGDYREAIQAQQTYISKMEWKTSDILFPMPTLAAPTSEFIEEQRGNILVTAPAPDRNLENSVIAG
jgi:hypothetical protein